MWTFICFWGSLPDDENCVSLFQHGVQARSAAGPLAADAAAPGGAAGAALNDSLPAGAEPAAEADAEPPAEAEAEPPANNQLSRIPVTLGFRVGYIS